MMLVGRADTRTAPVADTPCGLPDQGGRDEYTHYYLAQTADTPSEVCGGPFRNRGPRWTCAAFAPASC